MAIVKTHYMLDGKLTMITNQGTLAVKHLSLITNIRYLSDDMLRGYP